jgi:hypothetical protein
VNLHRLTDQSFVDLLLQNSSKFKSKVTSLSLHSSHLCVFRLSHILCDDNRVDQVRRRLAFVDQVIAANEIDAVGCFDVLLPHILLQKVAFLIVNDVSLVGDVAPVEQVILDWILDSFLVKIRVLLLINKLPLICACIENLHDERG